MQRVLRQAGVVLTLLGLAALLGAVALPWVRYRLGRGPRGPREYRLAVLDVSRGVWFLTLVVVLVGLVALAGLAPGRARQIGGLAAPVVGLVAAVLVVTMPAALNGTAAGGWCGFFAAPLLGFAGGLLSLGRAAR